MKREKYCEITFSRMCYLGMFVCSLTLYPFENTDAFDGKREGPFLGIGIGLGIEANREIYKFEDEFEDGEPLFYGSPSITTHFKIGYGLSEELLLYLTGRSSLNGFYRYSFYYDDFSRDLRIFNDGTYGLGFMFFPNPNEKLYLSGCFGLVISLYLNKPDIPDIKSMLTGLGVSGGVGWEIVPNFAFDVTLDYRRVVDTSTIPVTTDSPDILYETSIDRIVDDLTLSFAFNMLLY